MTKSCRVVWNCGTWKCLFACFKLISNFHGATLFISVYNTCIHIFLFLFYIVELFQAYYELMTSLWAKSSTEWVISHNMLISRFIVFILVQYTCTYIYLWLISFNELIPSLWQLWIPSVSQKAHRLSHKLRICLF